MQSITATRIHDGHRWLPEGTTIEVADDGTIVALHPQPNSNTKYYEGTLTPGFVNAHCHLELSHMKGVAAENTGLIPFLKNIPLYRDKYTEEEKKAARHKAFEEMLRNGVVAVGDIANTADTMDLRAHDKIHFHTFAEALGFNDAGAQRSFEYMEQVYNAFAGQQSGKHRLMQAIVPHAPYSVSASLFRLIDAHREGAVISIHNQESEEENKYYLNKEGTVGDLLHVLGIDDSLFVPTGKPSLESYLQWLSPGHPFIFVHNTSSTVEDVRLAQNFANEVYWCLCPNANLYIEDRLPDIDMLVDENVNICIGTDSLASNHQLSVLAELQTIKRHYPNISWEMLLHWATANGAKALQMQDIVGTIEVGMKPGIVFVQGIEGKSEDFTARKIA